EPLGVCVARGLTGRPPSQEEDVRHHGRSLSLKGVRGKANGSDKVGPRGQVLPDGGILFVQAEVTCDEGEDAPWLQSVNGLCEKEVVEGKLHPAVIEPQVRKGHVPDDGINTGVCELRITEVLDADVLHAVEGPGNSA